ncbi:hypothetical protein PIB30_050984 [Stylosanthes scabra]|uniref:Protein kinase domain-containing protein n=1 Tax=Stylosanthes scabra TaxID=79078 RepID=A0ABU6RHU6_9FABA|nr:hypothetical protein [Stylosanthes scabra]
MEMRWPEISAFPRQMLKNLQNQETMELLLEPTTMAILQQSLLTVAAVADDAQENLFAKTSTLSSNMAEWLCHFQDIMYLLDELLCKFDHGKAITATGAEDAKREVDFILRRFETITNQKHLLFLTEKQEQQLSSFSLPPSQNLRRDKEMNEMVDFLLSARENTSMIAVVGAAWTGRATLAHLVCNQDRVKACFELRGWVDFQQELDSKSLANIILDSFNEDFHYEESLPELIERLHKCLQGKKVLLVLNGFRNLAGWEALRSCFSGAAGQGSAVILTTSELDVAFEMLSDHVLSLEDSLLDSVDEKNRSISCDPQGFPVMWTGTSLYHLVRLEIVGSWISYLPDEIGELRFLEYIDLSFSEIRALPDSIGMLSRLETLMLAFCCYLRELPSTMENLINLRYLDLMGTKLLDMALKLGSFNNLQTLIDFAVSMNSGSNLTELATVLDIQTLSITELQNIVEARNAAEAKLKEKRRLEELVLRWNQLHFAECEQVLEYLEPPKQLKNLGISGCPERRFPYWLGDASFTDLKVIYIYDCKNIELLPPLGQLSSLQELYIRGCGNVRSVGNEFYGHCSLHVPFKSLEILWFVDMPSWKEWILLDDESLQFPCLRELYLIQCPELVQDLPKHLPSLKTLEIIQCDHLVSPPPKIPHQVHELMEQKQEQEQGCTEILATSLAEVTSESSSHHATIKEGGTIIMPPVTNGKGDELISDDDDDGGVVDFESCFEIVKIADASELCNLTSRIKSLRIEGCQFLESLPDEFLKNCSNIRELFFIDCYSLKNFSDVLHPSSLRTIYIHKCPNLDFLIPLGTHKKFALLEYLCISSSCELLASISLNIFPRLRTLYIKDCPNLESFSIDEGLRERNLKLESLEIRDYKCPELESFPEGGLPSSLSLLSIAFSDKLAPKKEWKLDMLPSLTDFEIESGCIGMKSFPDKDFLPRNLKSLRLSKLSSLRILNGTGFQHLTALETLEINCCHGLYTLPEGLPSSLTRLCIKESPILSQKLFHRAGSEWSKIAHIPNLQIDEDKKEGEIPEQNKKFKEKRFVARSTYLEGGKRMPMMSNVSHESDWSKIAHTSNLQLGDGIKEGSTDLEGSLKGKRGSKDEKSLTSQQWHKTLDTKKWMPPTLNVPNQAECTRFTHTFHGPQLIGDGIKEGKGGQGIDHEPSRLYDSWTSSIEAKTSRFTQIFNQTMSKKKVRHLEDFTLQELLESTDNFSEDKKIGRGSFGSVYHAILRDGREVAIKRAVPPNFEDRREYEFVNELQIHPRIHHNNLVGLLGFYRDANERILVYDYMNNGSLYDHLHNVQSSSVLMSWPARIKVALDAARGIEYLHHYAVPPIIHHDIKSPNILLDSKWTAKLCDFGISLKAPEDDMDTHTTVELAGTLGYLDPEYITTQRLTTKSDVYGFGVVLLEILTGRKATHTDGERIYLPSYAVPYIDKGELFKVLDPRMPPPTAAVEYLGNLAAQCVRPKSQDRPTMFEVVIHLERALASCLALPAI